jgi:hypothetical protein
MMDGMDRVDRADETSTKSTPAGYFIAIISVVGGTLLIPPFSFVFTIMGALLLLGLILLLLINRSGHREKRLELHRSIAKEIS